MTNRFEIMRFGAFREALTVGIQDSPATKMAKQATNQAEKFLGDYKKFKKATLGEIEIKAAGLQKITVSPKEKGWSPLNLRKLTLTPVK